MQAGIAKSAAALPERQRAERERPFWQVLAAAHGWRRVADAGCGGGFHLRVLRALGIWVVGFDLSPGTLPAPAEGPVVAANLLAPPLRAACFDAVLCLGNTLSLLPGRQAQRRALAGLSSLLKPGGMLVLQAEDAAVTVAGGPRVRTRALPDGRIHVRAYERRGARVRMLAGVVRPGEDAPLEAVQLLPTSAAHVAAMARPLGLAPVSLAPPAPGAIGTWWLGLRTAPR